MASTAIETAGERLTSDLRGLIHAAVPAFGSRAARRSGGGDLEVARALASVGLGGLVLLPLLMLASLALESPLAGPAAIALGYLPCARELALARPRRAMMWAAAVLAGLVAWTLAPFLIGGGEPPGPAIGAAFFAPIFAAAPALARHIIAPKQAPEGASARQMAECLDRMAPSEAVLFVSRAGTLSAGTRAGLAALELPSEAADVDVARCFDVMDRPALLDALALCENEDAPVEVTLTRSDNEGDASLIATISTGPQSLRTLRIRPADIAAGEAVPDESRGAGHQNAGPARERPGPICRIERDLAFAIRSVAATARGNGATLICDIERGLMAVGDDRSCRRMLGLILGPAVRAGKAQIEVAGRRVKGVVLLRVSVATSGAGDIWDTEKAALIAEIADQLGGTALVEHSPERQRVSVRLVSAPGSAAQN
jgi:hypothetical protein